MGCDIHMYKEKQVNGVWLTADEWQSYDYGDGDAGMEVDWGKQFSARNYNLFGLLAEVRTEHAFSFKRRGIPFNVSPEVRAAAEYDGADGHSHSYLYLHELKDMLVFCQTATITISGMKDAGELAQLNESIASGKPDWSLLFPYSQWTNVPNNVHFELAVPADFYFGEHLREIIASFDGVEGDNHRVVFWFDN
jgi:hypothetical protein